LIPPVDVSRYHNHAAIIVTNARPSAPGPEIIAGSARLRRAHPIGTLTLKPGHSKSGPGGIMGIIWIVIVGFVAGIIARFLSPGPNNPAGFILTTVLGIAGAFLATFIGQLIGWYRPDQGAGFITATIGALVVLFIWNRLVVSGRVRDPSAGP